MTEAFKQEAVYGPIGKIFDLYDIRVYQPSITILDADGKKLHGPFSGSFDGSFSSLGRDKHETLADFLDSNGEQGVAPNP